MKKFLIITSKIIIILISLFIFYINNKNNVTHLLEYAPFNSKYENIISLNIDAIKVSSNLPKIDVATAFYPLASSIVQSIYDENGYNNELSYTSTSAAYKDLLDGKADIIMVTSPSESQQKMIEQSNMNLKFIPIAKEALIFYTWKHNLNLFLHRNKNYNKSNYKHVSKETRRKN